MPGDRKQGSSPSRRGRAKPFRQETRGASASGERTGDRPGPDRRGGRPRPPGRRPGRVPEARGLRPTPFADTAESEQGDDESGSSGIRLQKFLAMAGVDSRRNCEEYIRTGRVTVDGEVVLDPARSVDPDGNDIRLDTERLRLPRFRYFLLNKPKGVLCTNRDPQGRPRAVDLVPAADQRLFTVGRLDEMTEGLLLLTNDGQLAQHLAHPKFEVTRRYRCQVAGLPSPEILAQLKEGMHFAEGFFRFRSVRMVKKQGRSAVLELELREGKNREIRRLMARVGHKVLTLERVAFGPLTLGSLAPGRYRELQPFEVHALRHFVEHGQFPDQRDEPQRGRGFGYRPGQTQKKRKPAAAGGPSEASQGQRPKSAGSRRPKSGRPSDSGRPATPSGKGRDRRRHRG